MFLCREIVFQRQIMYLTNVDDLYAHLPLSVEKLQGMIFRSINYSDKALYHALELKRKLGSHLKEVCIGA